MTKRVLFIMTSTNSYPDGTRTGAWMDEAIEPYEILRTAGIKVTLASTKGGSVPYDPQSIADSKLQNLIESGKHWLKKKFTQDEDKNSTPNWKQEFIEQAKNTLSLQDIDISNFDALYLPGGHGTVFDFADNPEFALLLAEAKEKGLWLASVCHGPAAYVGAKDKNGEYLVKGVTMTSFTDDEEKAVGQEKKAPFLLQTELEKQGARFIAHPNFTDHVEVDGQFISGQNPQSSISVGKSLKEKLMG